MQNPTQNSQLSFRDQLGNVIAWLEREYRAGMPLVTYETLDELANLHLEMCNPDSEEF